MTTSDVMRIALTGQRHEGPGLWTHYGIVINEHGDEVWTGPGRATSALAQTDANSAAESLTVPAPWAKKVST